MAGTRAGAKKTVKTIEAKFTKDYWRQIGSVGGKAPCAPNGGFKDRDLARRAGQLGGLMGRRNGTKLTPEAKQKVRDGLKHGYKPTLDRDDYILEQRAEDMAKNQSIAAKYGKARPW